MRPAIRCVLLALLALLVPLGVGVSADAHTTGAAHGSRHARPAAYHWADGSYPSDTYTITVLRGASTHQVLHRLGIVKLRLGQQTFRQAEKYALDHLRADYSSPPVVQVSRLGSAVVVYEPLGARAFFHPKRMTPHALMASFTTDVDLDTYLRVARDGRIIRSIDPMSRPSRNGRLPEERGLHFGARHGNPFARSWALIERLTLTHITRSWFRAPHPTYVLRGSGL